MKPSEYRRIYLKGLRMKCRKLLGRLHKRKEVSCMVFIFRQALL